MSMVQLDVVHSSWEETTRFPSSGDEWDRGDTHTSHTVEHLKIAPNGDLHVEGPVAIGDRFYVVYAIYSTGDSFGHDSCRRIEFFTAHRRYEVAQINEKALEQAKEKDGYSTALFTDEGVTFPAYVPWLGYFESLDRVCVEELEVRA